MPVLEPLHKDLDQGRLELIIEPVAETEPDTEDLKAEARLDAEVEE